MCQVRLGRRHRLGGHHGRNVCPGRAPSCSRGASGTGGVITAGVGPAVSACSGHFQRVDGRPPGSRIHSAFPDAGPAWVSVVFEQPERGPPVPQCQERQPLL